MKIKKAREIKIGLDEGFIERIDSYIKASKGLYGSREEFIKDVLRRHIMSHPVPGDEPFEEKMVVR